MRRRVLEVALPLARPAIAAGAALALMETLADYGVGAYFGLATFSTGIYKAWLVMNDRIAAAQLASVLLLVVAALLLAERAAQRRMRFAASRGGAAHVGRSAAAGAARRCRGGGRGRCARCRCCWASCCRWPGWCACCGRKRTHVGVRPAAGALRAMGLGQLPARRRWPRCWPRRWRWRWASRCASARGGLLPPAARVLSLGYAVPGAVIAVGILLPVGWLQDRWPRARRGGARHRHGVRPALRLPGALLGGGAAVGGGRLRPRAAVASTRRRACSAAARRRLFVELHLPLLRRSALAAALLVFVDVMKELPATLVLRPFGSDTLAVVAYNFARDERLAEAALPSLAIVAVGLIPVVMLTRAMRAPAG